VVISRLSDQKGMDLLLAALPVALAQGAQLALLGTGDHRLEDAFLTLADAHPQQVSVTIGYSEPLAHRLQAGGDILVMPSRFEPCGLSQLYAMRYGTLPIGHRTGGLADTIIDASYDNMLKDSANGFLFDRPTAGALQWAIERALGLFRRPTQWQKLQHHAMTLDYGWKPAALSYLDLYRTLRPEPGAAGTGKAKPSRKATRNKE